MGSRKIDSQVRILLTDTILALCKNTLNQYGEVAVEGLLGITLDKKEIFLVSLQEVIRNNKGGGSKRSERSKSKHSDDSEATYDSDDSTSSRSKRKRRKKHKRSRSTDNEGTPKSKADVSIKLENVEDDDLYVTKETIKRKRPNVGSSDQSSSQSGYSADAQMAQYQSGGPMRAAPSGRHRYQQMANVQRQQSPGRYMQQQNLAMMQQQQQRRMMPPQNRPIMSPQTFRQPRRALFRPGAAPGVVQNPRMAQNMPPPGYGTPMSYGMNQNINVNQTAGSTLTANQKSGSGSITSPTVIEPTMMSTLASITSNGTESQIDSMAEMDTKGQNLTVLVTHGPQTAVTWTVTRSQMASPTMVQDFQHSRSSRPSGIQTGSGIGETPGVTGAAENQNEAQNEAQQDDQNEALQQDGQDTASQGSVRFSNNLTIFNSNISNVQSVPNQSAGLSEDDIVRPATPDHTYAYADKSDVSNDAEVDIDGDTCKDGATRDVGQSVGSTEPTFINELMGKVVDIGGEMGHRVEDPEATIFYEAESNGSPIHVDQDPSQNIMTRGSKKGKGSKKGNGSKGKKNGKTNVGKEIKSPQTLAQPRDILEDLAQALETPEAKSSQDSMAGNSAICGNVSTGKGLVGDGSNGNGSIGDGSNGNGLMGDGSTGKGAVIDVSSGVNQPNANQISGDIGKMTSKESVTTNSGGQEALGDVFGSPRPITQPVDLSNSGTSNPPPVSGKIGRTPSKKVTWSDTIAAQLNIDPNAPYDCISCGVTLTSVADLSSHILHRPCCICGVHIKHVSSFKKHLRDHVTSMRSAEQPDD